MLIMWHYTSNPPKKLVGMIPFLGSGFNRSVVQVWQEMIVDWLFYQIKMNDRLGFKEHVIYQMM